MYFIIHAFVIYVLFVIIFIIQFCRTSLYSSDSANKFSFNKDVEDLGRRLGYTLDNQNFHNVSLGQGQESVAEQAMDVAAKNGHWVVLQNIHLVKKWLPLLEKKLEIAADGSHENYRVFMSAEPASTSAGHIIPQVIFYLSHRCALEYEEKRRENSRRIFQSSSKTLPIKVQK